MQIKIYRGTHQIGGCVTEIFTKQARIIIDMGAELPQAGKTTQSQLAIDGITQGAPRCDAVFITHYHGDHVGMTQTVLPSIPIYMGQAAKQIYGTVQQTLQTKLGTGNASIVDNFKTFQAGKPIYIKDICVTPFCIDHSAFDAYMFLIEAEGKRILHTGDFRMHGARGRKMPTVFKRYAESVDVLIIEGTMMSRLQEEVVSEHDLGKKATQILRQNQNVFVLVSSTNVDTIAEFYKAAIATRKPFVVCDDYQRQILQIVTANSKSSFYNFDRQKVYVYGNNLHSFLAMRGFCFVGRANYATQKALESFPQNVLVYSMWQGYLNAAHPAYDEYKAQFVQNAVSKGSKYQYLHTSGHASAQQIKQVCQLTHAKFIIPIHSENPENFTKLGISGKLCLLSDGESFLV